MISGDLVRRGLILYDLPPSHGLYIQWLILGYLRWGDWVVDLLGLIVFYDVDLRGDLRGVDTRSLSPGDIDLAE